MVKGLAKFGNRLRHGRKTKYVDAGPLQEGRLLPNDGRHSSQERRGGRSPRNKIACCPPLLMLLPASAAQK